MTPWSALAAVILTILAALPNILLYINDRQRKFNLVVGLFPIFTALAFFSIFFTMTTFLAKENNRFRTNCSIY